MEQSAGRGESSIVERGDLSDEEAQAHDHHSLVVTQQDVYIIIIIIPVYSSILQTHRSVSISCLFIDKMRRDKSTRD